MIDTLSRSPSARLLRVAVVLLACCGPGRSAHAEVLIRWDQPQIPSPLSLGISTVVVPAGNVRSALAAGYRVWVEVDASALAGFTPPAGDIAGVAVNGEATAAQLASIKQRLRGAARVVVVDVRGKWPHIRTNWVTSNNGVLQVSNRSAQPWIENNAALMRLIRATAAAGAAPWVSYPWRPITLSDIDEGPDVEHYLVAIAEAGSFGGDLLLPLHERFQKSLLMGEPRARAGWDRIRRYVEFYSWDLPARYHPSANVGVVASDPMAWFEIMNLLARHNLPFEWLSPGRVRTDPLDAFALLIVLDRPDPAALQTLAAFVRKGGTLVVDAAVSRAAGPAAAKMPWAETPPVQQSDDRASYRLGEGRVVEVLKGVPDPNRFALEIRELLGPQRRVLDIWNGITVVAAAYANPDGSSALVTALNYAHQPLPVQLRVAGTYSLVQYESPEAPPARLPYQHRDGYTEFVLPALEIGGRVFLSRSP